MSVEEGLARAKRRGVREVRRVAAAWRAWRPGANGHVSSPAGAGGPRAAGAVRADAMPSLPERHGVPAPPGTTAQELLARLRTWSVNGEPPGHLDAYVDDSFERFLHTWALVPGAPG